MSYHELLVQMFDGSLHIKEEDNVITGVATYNKQEFILAGVVNESPLNNIMCEQFAGFILDKISINPTCNILIMVDTAGQAATHHDELVGLNRYSAHLAKVLHFARGNGARVFALVHGKALGGAFIATALNAEKIYALESAQIAVMWLEAMSVVTKVPLEKLKELSKISAIFAPGAENFVKLGVVESLLTPGQIMPQIAKDLLSAPADINQWRLNGAERGGRTMAHSVVNAVLSA